MSEGRAVRAVITRVLATTADADTIELESTEDADVFSIDFDAFSEDTDAFSEEATDWVG